jgi:tRNA uridine 5-carbamoylmethylation protein Kti12
MNKLIILQGIPASGKSTIAKQWQAEEPTKRVIICKDSFRLSRGQYWIPEQEDYIKKLEKCAIELAVQRDYDIILDGTNFNKDYIYEIIGMVRYWNNLSSILAKYYIMEFWLVHADKDECIKRDFNIEDRDHIVGEQVIEMFYNKYLDWCKSYNIEVKSEGIYKYDTRTVVEE